MRKQILQLTLMLCCILAMPLATFGATTFYDGGLKYTINTDDETTVSVTGYETAPSGTLTIPSTVTDGDNKYTVTAIGSSAFCNCTYLNSIELPTTVTTIGSDAFGCCYYLTVTFAEGSQLTTIGDYAFLSCNSGLTAIELPATVTTIGEGAFKNCLELASVTVNNPTPVQITSGTFSDISNSAVLYVPAGSAEAYEADTSWADSFSSIVELLTIDGVIYSIDNSNVTVIGYTTIPENGELKIPAKVANDEVTYTVTAIADGARYSEGVFYNCTELTSVTIPETITSIGNYAFRGCSLLASVTFAEGSELETIGTSAFYSCSALTSIDIPVSVTTIGTYAFYQCSSLESVTFAEDSELETIGTYAFASCSVLSSIDIPESVTSIGSSVFNGCRALKVVKVNWTNDNDIVAYSTSLFTALNILVVPDGQVDIYKAREDGWQDFLIITDNLVADEVIDDNGLKYILTADTDENITALLSGYNAISNDLVIPNTVNYDNADYPVTSIGSYAFYYCSSLASVVIPESVTTIGNYAFFYCSSLASVVIPDGVTTIGASTFRSCSSLASVVIPESVTTIGNYAFYQCSSLASVVIPESVTSIGTSAFYNCTSLASVVIPESVTTIGTSAFRSCSSLASVTLQTTNTGITSNVYTFGSIAETATLYVPTGSESSFSESSYYSSNFDYFVEYTDGLTVIKEDGVKDLTTDSKAYLNITIEEGAEINAEGNENIVILDALTIERTFEYESGKASNEQWFSLGLPFEVTAGTGCVLKSNDDGEYVEAVQGVDYATYDYDGARHYKYGAEDGTNWIINKTDEGYIGELIQFAEVGEHKYKFIASGSAATTALTKGRDGERFYGTTDNAYNDNSNGWNVVPAGKTYTTAYAIVGVSVVQSFNSDGSWSTGVGDAKLTPGTVYAAQLTEEVTTSDNQSLDSEEIVEKYTFELIDADGAVIDRIFLFDGSNKTQYRVAKMGAFSTSATISISVDGTSYCAYSTLASETDKSHLVALSNLTDGCQLVMTAEGSQGVAVDGVSATLDTPISVKDGEIVITIGSTVTGVDSLTDESLVINGANGTISISGVEAGTAYAITAMSGITTYGTASGETTCIDKPAGVYVVRINNTVTKVIVK